jgi:sulfide:quinone oxidoreductase
MNGISHGCESLTRQKTYMAQILQVEEQLGIAGQLTPADLRYLAADGIKLIINNRPDGEVHGQPTSAEMAAEANRLGMSFVNIPFVYPTPAQIIEFAEALKAANGYVVVYCKSGHRSSIIWAAAKIVMGVPPSEVAAMGTEAGIDFERVVGFIEDLAKEAAQAR